MKMITYCIWASYMFIPCLLGAQEWGQHGCFPTTGQRSLTLFEDGHILLGQYQNHYLTKEISDVRLEGSHVLKGNGMVWNLRHTGFHAYGTLEMRLGYGRRFGKRVCVSLQGCYLWTHAQHYESLHSFTIHFSATYQMNHKMVIAFSTYNPIHMKYGIIGKEVIPMEFDLLLRHLAGRQVWLDLFVHKGIPLGFEAGGSVHYFPKQKFSFHLTCSNLRCRFGIASAWKSWMLCVQGEWCYRLGFSPCLELYYEHLTQKP